MDPRACEASVESMSRWGQGLLLGVLLAFVGLVAGTAVGATQVPEGSGLAGPAIALGYGFVAALIGAVSAALTARFAPQERVSTVIRVASIAALAAALVIVWRIVQVNSGS